MLPIDRDRLALRPSGCPICGSKEVYRVFSLVRDHVTDTPFAIETCRDCDVSSTFPVPANMDSYYPLEYRGYGPLITGILRGFYVWRVRQWARMKKEPGAALEIGCGTGMMLEALRQRGWRVTGIERAESMAAFARKNLGLDVLSGGLDKLPPEVTFDLIILFQVLEHLADPLEVLQECRRRLNPGGILVISVPNFSSWQARFGGPVWLHLDPPRHLFHFSPASLGKLMKRVGMEILEVGFVSVEHDPYGWVESAINRITGGYNILTRFLMGLEPFNRRVFLSCFLAVVLAGPAVLLSILSWTCGKGAIFQMVASLPPRETS